MKNAYSQCDAATGEIWSKSNEVVVTKHHCEVSIIRHVLMHRNLNYRNLTTNKKQNINYISHKRKISTPGISKSK